MSGPCVIALDQGTTNTKAHVLDEAGLVRFSFALPIPIATTADGFVEQDPEAIWRSAVQSLEACLENVEPSQVRAIGVSNQRETVLFWDRRTGRPVTPAASWQCRRSEAACALLAQQQLGARIAEATGLRIDPLFSASKAAWFLRHSEELESRARAGEICMGTIDSWLVFKMSNGATHSTDAGNASRTQLLNLSTADWDPEMLKIFEIPAEVLPRVSDSSAVYAVTAGVDEIPAGIPIASAIGDSHAALIGHGIFQPGPVKATYGTGSSLMMLSPHLASGVDSLARTIAWKLGGSAQYAWEGNITMTGAGLRWVGEFAGSSTPTQTALALADSVSDAGGVYFIPAMNGLGAPHWDSAARGLIHGLTRNSTLAHVARAAIDAIAHQVADVFEETRKVSPQPATALYTDGAGSRNDFLMQLQSDLIGVPVKRSSFAELSARGAGLLAGLAVGLWKSPADLESLAPETDVFEPRRSIHEVSLLREGWREALSKARSQSVSRRSGSSNPGEAV